uniref:ATP-binding cassette domain-containing protein n=1 Tax=Thaumasiovibrio occultus TaxID=1891184 RepID=UPI000B352589|nr:ATP-binding cassette domain-containing protein [Thaumasiovibrio occultus]
MSLELRNFSINLAEKMLLSPLSLTVAPGEVVTIMGPSGCGKSTLLNAIGGHYQADFTYRGNVVLNKLDVTDLPAWQRGIGLLFQDDLLFPHLNIWQNLALALPTEIAQREETVRDTLASIDLAHLADMHPSQASGGQRARISLLRALLAKPNAILLDEPFSKLDKTLRESFRAFVYQQLSDANIPAILVTHDDSDIPINGQCLLWQDNLP